MSDVYDIIVVGGGPAGMMAALRGGDLGRRVLVLEKNDRLGKKLSITGGGRCNITNAEFDNRLFLGNFGDAARYLYSPFSQFNVEDAFEFFESRGMGLMVEDRGRAFPVSESAEDVCDLLEDGMERSGNVEVMLRTALVSFILEDGALVGVRTSRGDFFGKSVVLATGGFAAPETGSTGEGVTLLGGLGHSVKKPDANLVPLRTPVRWVHRLSGVSLDNVEWRYFQGGRARHKVRGRLLFTHFGISGPGVINSAYIVKKMLSDGVVSVSLDLFPDLDFGALDRVVLGLFERNPRKRLRSVMRELVKRNVCEEIFGLLGHREVKRGGDEVDFGEMLVSDIDKESRKRLVHILKDLSFPISGTMGLSWSIVADGGVDVGEVNFKTMESKIVPGLYLVGDVLSINRPSGGFSLQLCWTTGWVAGGCAGG